MATADLPDSLWNRLEPLLPKPKENRHVQFAGRKPTAFDVRHWHSHFVLRNGRPHRPPTLSHQAKPAGHLRQWHELESGSALL